MAHAVVPSIPPSIAKTISPIFLLLFPSIALAATPRTFGDIVTIALTLVGQATLALMITAVAIYFGHIAFSIVKSNKGEAGPQRAAILWGIIIIFVMVSIWGIIQILQNTLFNGTGNVGAPQSSAGCTNFGDPGCGGE